MKRVFAPVCVLLIACGSSSIDWTRLSVAQRQKALQDISAKCRLPADRFQIGPGDELRFQPRSSDPYENVDCALGELKRLHGVRLGFVGNEFIGADTREENVQ